MTQDRLTKKQQDLIRELDELTSLLGLDYRDIRNIEMEFRTPALKIMKDQMIRSAVILKYCLIDELLSGIICGYFFGTKRSFIQLWKTKRFQTFNYFIIEKLYLQQKLDLVKGAHDIPTWVTSEVARLNDLRNALAHSFFPENRRRKPEWKGKQILSMEGTRSFMDDMGKLSKFFLENFFGGSIENL